MAYQDMYSREIKSRLFPNDPSGIIIVVAEKVDCWTASSTAAATACCFSAVHASAGAGAGGAVVVYTESIVRDCGISVIVFGYKYTSSTLIPKRAITFGLVIYCNLSVDIPRSGADT